jgi:hypothetical protein
MCRQLLEERKSVPVDEQTDDGLEFEGLPVSGVISARRKLQLRQMVRFR